MHEATVILHRLEQGDPHAAQELLPLVYNELRKLAAAKMAREPAGQTLQPTALVHEPNGRPATRGGVEPSRGRGARRRAGG